jgi:hypothetical protein
MNAFGTPVNNITSCYIDQPFECRSEILKLASMEPHALRQTNGTRNSIIMERTHDQDGKPIEVESPKPAKDKYSGYSIAFRPNYQVPDITQSLTEKRFYNVTLRNSELPLELEKEVECLKEAYDQDLDPQKLPPVHNMICERILIHAPYLVKIVSEMTGYQTKTSNDEKESLLMVKSYTELASYREQLSEKRQELESKLAMDRKSSGISANMIEEWETTVDHIKQVEHVLDIIVY